MNRSVGRLIAGISLYDGLVLVAVGSYIGAMLAVMTFLSTLYFQHYVKGT